MPCGIRLSPIDIYEYFPRKRSLVDEAREVKIYLRGKRGNECVGHVALVVWLAEVGADLEDEPKADQMSKLQHKAALVCCPHSKADSSTPPAFYIMLYVACLLGTI